MCIKNFVINLVFVVGGFVMFLLFVWMLSLLLKFENEIYMIDIVFLFWEWDFVNYVEVWIVGYVGMFVINGVIVMFGIFVL